MGVETLKPGSSALVRPRNYFGLGDVIAHFLDNNEDMGTADDLGEHLSIMQFVLVIEKQSNYFSTPNLPAQV